MKKSRKKILLSLSTILTITPIISLISCGSQKKINDTNNDSLKEIEINNEFISKIKELISINLSTATIIDDVFNKYLVNEISKILDENFIDIKLIDIKWNLTNSKNEYYKISQPELIFNTYIKNVNNNTEVNIINKNLKFLCNFDTKILNDNIDFSISTYDQYKINKMIEEFCINYYIVNATNFDDGTNQKTHVLVEQINSYLSKKIYPKITDIKFNSYDIYPKNGHKKIFINIEFDTSIYPLSIIPSTYFDIENNTLKSLLSYEINVNSIIKDSNGKWDLSYVLPALKDLIISTGLKISSRTEYSNIINASKDKISDLLSPHLTAKLTRIQNETFFYGDSGKQEFNFQIDFGSLPIIRLVNNYESYGFEYISNRYLTLKKVISNIDNLEISKNNINITILLPKIIEIINKHINQLSNFDEIENVVKNLKNNLNDFLGLELIEKIEILEDTFLINSKKPYIDTKVNIIFKYPYKVQIDNNSEYYNQFNVYKNILTTPLINTLIESNYNNIASIVDERFSQLTIEEIKSDVENHVNDNLIFLKDNIDYIQQLLILISNNEQIYNLLIDNYVIIGNLINNILSKSIRKDLMLNDLLYLFFSDAPLNKILSNKNAVTGLCNLVYEFLPNQAESIVGIINTIKVLPINLIISTLKTLLKDVLPENILNSLDDLRKLGVLSFIIEHDIDLLTLIPSSNILTILLSILQKTSVENFKNTGIIDFLVSLLKTNNGKNDIRDLLYLLFNTNGNSVIGKILNTFIFENSSLNSDTLAGLFYLFANPTDSSGNLIKYKNWFDNIRINKYFNGNPTLNNKNLKLEYVARFTYQQNLYFNLSKMYKLFPNFKIHILIFDVDKQFLINNLPSTLGIFANDYLEYKININNEIKYHVDEISPNNNVLSWQAMANEVYDVNMKRSCENWYRSTPKSAFIGAAKLFSKYVTGIFYHIWDVNLNFKPDTSILNDTKINKYFNKSQEMGYIKIKNPSNSVMDDIKRKVDASFVDYYVKGTEYEWSSSGFWKEYVKISQYRTGGEFDPYSVINELIDFSNYKGTYEVKINRYTLAKSLNVLSFDLPSIRMSQIIVYFPNLVPDEKGNFYNSITFNV